METTRSADHRRLERWLDEIGVAYESEVEVLNYALDIYLPEFHMAIEVDGPYHGVKRERRRDAQILDATGILTLRVKGYRVEHTHRIIRAIERWAPSAADRQSGRYPAAALRQLHDAGVD